MHIYFVLCGVPCALMFYTCYVYNVCLHNKLPSSHNYHTTVPNVLIKILPFSQTAVQNPKSKLANSSQILFTVFCLPSFTFHPGHIIKSTGMHKLPIPRLLCGPSCENFMTRRMSDQNRVPCQPSKI